jgi:hypothetical protein
MEGFMAENDVAVAGAPEGISDRLSDSDRNTIRQFGRILSVGKGFLGLSSYSEERSFLRSLNNPNGDGPSQEEFLAFFAEQTTSAFWNIAKPKVQAQELSEIIARFEQKKQCEAYLKALETELSPHNNAQLQAHIGNLGDVSDKVKMAAARGFVLGDLGKQYEDTRKNSGIRRSGNLWHTTLGRNVAAPVNRLFQPIASHMKAFQATSGAWGKVLGLSVAGGIAFWAAAALLFPVSALGVVGAVIFAGGGVAAAFQMPGAFKNLTRVQAQAEAARIQRDENFAKQNQKYRVGREFTNENTAEKSLITIEGIQEHHFAGKARLNVTTGAVMLPEAMHLRYAGFADLVFDRKTQQLRITLQNSDGIPPEQKATMIQEIVTACTGQEIKKSVVLGKPCDGFQGMKDALNANEETIVNNRLADLVENKLPLRMDEILAKALLSPSPKDPASGGIARYAATAAEVLLVAEGNYDAFKTKAETKLQEALSELTGKEDIRLEQANPVTTAAAQIMGNVTKNYDKLGENEQKLALANLALGNVPKNFEKYRNVIATAAAIEASRLGVTEQQIENVRQISARLDQNREGESSDIGSFGKEVLNALNLKGPSGKLDVDDLRVSKSILNSTFPKNFSVSPEAWQVVAAQAQKQAALSA